MPEKKRMPKTNYCDHSNSYVIIDTCIACHLCCIFNPNSDQAGIGSGVFTQRWSVTEFDDFIRRMKKDG